MSVINNNYLELLIGLIIFGLLTVVTLPVVSWLFGKRRRSLPYIAQSSLNTPTEQAFLAALQRAIDSNVMVACKVRLADVLQVRFRQRHPRDQRWWQLFRMISSKHVDFVLCEPNGGRILIAIELDDSSHRRRDSKHRDRFKDQAFASAGIPLLRFAASGRYDSGEIKRRLVPHLTTLQEGSAACHNAKSTIR